MNHQHKFTNITQHKRNVMHHLTLREEV